jgi:hypothetical protein
MDSSTKPPPPSQPPKRQAWVEGGDGLGMGGDMSLGQALQVALWIISVGGILGGFLVLHVEKHSTLGWEIATWMWYAVGFTWICFAFFYCADVSNIKGSLRKCASTLRRLCAREIPPSCGVALCCLNSGIVLGGFALILDKTTKVTMGLATGLATVLFLCPFCSLCLVTINGYLREEDTTHPEDKALEILANLETHIFDGTSFEQQEGELCHGACAICLSAWDLQDQMKLTPCGHAFHEECLKGWLTRKQTCALCRKALTSCTSAGDP